jgi:hypothetical protein
MAYRQFAADHPEYPTDSDEASYQLCEFFEMEGKKVVDFNGVRLPLATDPKDWERAFEWKKSRGTLPLNMDAKRRLEAEELARQATERRQNLANEDDLYNMPMAAFKKLAGIINDR